MLNKLDAAVGRAAKFLYETWLGITFMASIGAWNIGDAIVNPINTIADTISVILGAASLTFAAIAILSKLADPATRGPIARKFRAWLFRDEGPTFK